MTVAELSGNELWAIIAIVVGFVVIFAAVAADGGGGTE